MSTLPGNTSICFEIQDWLIDYCPIHLSKLLGEGLKVPIASPLAAFFLDSVISVRYHYYWIAVSGEIGKPFYNIFIATVIICVMTYQVLNCQTVLAEWFQFTIVMTALANALTTAISEPAVSVCPHGWTRVDAIFFRDALIEEGNFALLFVAGWWDCIEMIIKIMISQVTVYQKKKFRGFLVTLLFTSPRSVKLHHFIRYSVGLIWNYSLPAIWQC